MRSAYGEEPTTALAWNAFHLNTRDSPDMHNPESCQRGGRNALSYRSGEYDSKHGGKAQCREHSPRAYRVSIAVLDG